MLIRWTDPPDERRTKKARSYLRIAISRLQRSSRDAPLEHAHIFEGAELNKRRKNFANIYIMCAASSLNSSAVPSQLQHSVGTTFVSLAPFALGCACGREMRERRTVADADSESARAAWDTRGMTLHVGHALIIRYR